MALSANATNSSMVICLSARLGHCANTEGAFGIKRINGNEQTLFHTSENDFGFFLIGLS